MKNNPLLAVLYLLLTPGLATPLIFMLLTITFWASSFAVEKSALASLSPLHLALLQTGISAFMVFLLFPSSRLRIPQLRDLPLILICGAVGIAAFHILLNYALLGTPAGVAAVLFASSSLWSSPLASLLFRDTFHPLRSFGTFIGLCGFATVFFLHTGTPQFSTPAALVIAASLCTTVSGFTQRKFLPPHRSQDLTAWIILAGALELLVLALIQNPLFYKTIAAAPTSAILESAYLGIFPGAVAFVLFSRATANVRIPALLSLTSTIPFLALLLAFLYLREVPSPYTLVGAILASIGSVLASPTLRRN